VSKAKPKAQLRAERVDQLFEQVIQKIAIDQQATCLYYLCGYCKTDKKFLEGLEAALRNNYPDLFKQFDVR
jgi:hypothetical protein